MKGSEMSTPPVRMGCDARPDTTVDDDDDDDDNEPEYESSDNEDDEEEFCALDTHA